jgi:hypothetical protein
LIVVTHPKTQDSAYHIQSVIKAKNVGQGSFKGCLTHRFMRHKETILEGLPKTNRELAVIQVL